MVGLYPIARPPPPAQYARWYPCRSRCNRFLNHAVSRTPTANKKEKETAIEYEKTNDYEPRHPFQPRIGLGQLLSIPSVIRRGCGGEKHEGGQNEKIERGHEMQEQKQKMKKDMKAQDVQLTEQLSKMNCASEDKEMGLMAAVLTHLMDQRITMDGGRTRRTGSRAAHRGCAAVCDGHHHYRWPSVKSVVQKVSDIYEASGVR